MTTLNQLSSLDGRLALVTGASGYLGKVIAETLAELGADLILVDRQDTELATIGAKLSERWLVDVACKICDLELEDERHNLILEVEKKGAPLNILINNAAFVGDSGLQGWAVPFKEQTVDTWRRALEVNLTAVFDLCKGFDSMMGRANGASIINIASIYGMHGPDWSLYDGTQMANPAAYGVSKGGLIQLSKWLSTTMGPNVRVNTISPGGIFRNQHAAFVSRYANRTPLKRMATEDDFRGVIAFLASDLSKYITGQNIVVDGGWGVW